MKTSIATVSINGTLKEKIHAIARAGFDGVEIFENDFLANDLSPKEVKKIVNDFSNYVKSEVVSMSTLEKNSISKIKAKLISYAS